MNRASRRPDYYEILGVSRSAEPELIDAAFRTLISKYRDNVSQQERARQIRLAYKVLSDPERKARYDASEQAAAVTVPEPVGSPHNGGTEPRHRRWIAGGALVAVIATAAFFAIDPLALENGPAPPKPEQMSAVESHAPTSTEKALVRKQTARSALPPAREGENPRVMGGLAPLPPQGLAPKVAAGNVVEPPQRVEPAASKVARQEILGGGVPATDQQGSFADTGAPQPALDPTPAPPTTPFIAEPAAQPQTQGTQPQWLSGGLVDADNRRGRFEGAVSVRLTVVPDGSATNCRVDRSSGDPLLDSITCRLLERRLRFAPARDTFGQPHASEVVATHVWERGRR